jgi:hypothetical protein
MKVSKNISDIVSEFRNGMLGSKSSGQMCFALGSALVGYLSFCGIKCELTEGNIGDWNHYWLTMPDKTIIDPTSDQFKKPDGSDMPLVYVGPKPEWYLTERKEIKS